MIWNSASVSGRVRNAAHAAFGIRWENSTRTTSPWRAAGRGLLERVIGELPNGQLVFEPCQPRLGLGQPVTSR